MEDQTLAVAEPSTAEDSNIGELTPDVKAAWNRGEQPKQAPPKPQVTAPVDPPKEAKSETKVETAADPEAAKSQELSKDKPPTRKLSAEERISQLTAEKKSLEERLRKRDAAPLPTQETKPAPKVEAPKRPNPFTWTGTPEAFEQAQDAYEKHLKQQAVSEAFQQQAQRESQREMQTRLTDARERYPDADTRIMPAVNGIMNDQQIPQAVRALIDASPVVVDLMYVLGDEGKLAEFIQTAKTNPIAALREVVVLEQLIQQELDAKSGKTETKTETEELEPEKPKAPVVPVTKAPKPVSEVGGRGTAPENSLVSAAKADDFRNFKKEADRQYLARHR